MLYKFTNFIRIAARKKNHVRNIFFFVKKGIYNKLKRTQTYCLESSEFVGPRPSKISLVRAGITNHISISRGTLPQGAKRLEIGIPDFHLSEVHPLLAK